MFLYRSHNLCMLPSLVTLLSCLPNRSIWRRASAAKFRSGSKFGFLVQAFLISNITKPHIEIRSSLFLNCSNEDRDVASSLPSGAVQVECWTVCYQAISKCFKSKLNR